MQRKRIETQIANETDKNFRKPTHTPAGERLTIAATIAVDDWIIQTTRRVFAHLRPGGFDGLAPLSSDL